MRDFILGIVAGLVLTRLPDWWRDYHVLSNYPYAPLYLAILALIVLIFRWPLVKLATRVNPRLYAWLDRFFAAPKSRKEGRCDAADEKRRNDP